MTGFGFEVEPTLAFHSKTVAAGNAAMGLWVRAGSWSAGQMTDGFVPAHIARQLGTPSQAQRLVAAGLWAAVSADSTRTGQSGYRFHEWAGDQSGSKRNPTRSEVQATRERWRKSKQRQRESKDAGQQPMSPRDSPENPEGVPEGVAPESSLSSSSSSSSSPVVNEVSRPPLAVGANDDGGTSPHNDLDQIAAAIGHHCDRDHAARVRTDVLGRATRHVGRPLEYVLSAIGADPERYRPHRGPRGDEQCPDHPGEWADNCRLHAAEAKEPVTDRRPF